MPIPPPRVGAVIRYGYIWHHEHRRGTEEGKERPAAIVLTYTTEVGGEIRVVVLPITHRKPSKQDPAIKIPAGVKRRLGLDSEHSWIICDEANESEWPGHDLRPIPGRKTLTWEYGMLGSDLFERVRKLFIETVKAKRLKHVARI